MRRTARKPWKRRMLCLSAALVLLVVAADIRLRPTARAAGVNAAKRQAMTAASNAVMRVLGDGVAYDRLMVATRDENGAVRSMEADAAAVNRLTAAVTAAVTEELNGEMSRLSVPIGTMTGSTLLMGRGPAVTLRLQQDGAVVTTLESRFDSAGINQTAHRLELRLQFSVLVLVPGTPETVSVDTNFLVAETVLVGDVPALFWRNLQE